MRLEKWHRVFGSISGEWLQASCSKCLLGTWYGNLCGTTMSENSDLPIVASSMGTTKKRLCIPIHSVQTQSMCELNTVTWG